jgi:hypothetical protein
MYPDDVLPPGPARVAPPVPGRSSRLPENWYTSGCDFAASRVVWICYYDLVHSVERHARAPSSDVACSPSTTGAAYDSLQAGWVDGYRGHFVPPYGGVFIACDDHVRWLRQHDFLNGIDSGVEVRWTPNGGEQSVTFRSLAEREFAPRVVHVPPPKSFFGMRRAITPPQDHVELAVWRDVIAAKPPTWYVDAPLSRPNTRSRDLGIPGTDRRWELYAFDTAEEADADRRRREWTALAPTRIGVLRQMARYLQAIGAGRVPK